MVEANDYVVVYFVREACAVCDLLERQMVEMEEVEGVPILRVDMTQLSTSIRKWDIQGFPTLKLFVHAREVEYRGEWASEPIRDWLRERVGSSFLGEVQEEIFLETFPRNVDVSVMYFYQQPLTFIQEYDQLARIFKGHRFLFSYTRLDTARQVLGVQPDVEFALWNQFGKNLFQFRGDKNLT